MSGRTSSPKILHVLYHSLPPQSGYAFRSHNILQAQAKRGWQVVALTAPQQEKSSFSKSQERIGGFQYYRAGAVPRGVGLFGTERRLMRVLMRRIREVVEVEKPDLLHAHSPLYNAIPALRVGREFGIPVVYEIRAFWEDAAVSQGTYGVDSPKYKLMRSLETQICHRVDQVVALCSGIKEELLKRGVPAKKIVVVPNGVDTDHFKPGLPDAEYMANRKLTGKRIIGFIGSFYSYEGLDLLLKSMSHLLPARPDVRLLLPGGGRTDVELKAEIARLGLGERVVMPGRVPHERIPAIYALCDILAYPRTSWRLTELTTPLKPLEAMAMGKAVVASNVGGHRELIQHGRTGLLFPAGDVAGLARTLNRLLDCQDLCQKLGRQASTWVRQSRSWDKVAAYYADVYAGALRQSKSEEYYSSTS
jgi:PEP-CTERM/exosortase A-associated glycosyltransferase